jgi:STE24 endopeptidase
MFYIFALFSAFVNNRSLYESFGFHNEYPIMIGFILFSDALAPMDAIVKFLMNILSRKFEFQAGMSRATYRPTQCSREILTRLP